MRALDDYAWMICIPILCYWIYRLFRFYQIRTYHLDVLYNKDPRESSLYKISHKLHSTAHTAQGLIGIIWFMAPAILVGIMVSAGVYASAWQDHGFYGESIRLLAPFVGIVAGIKTHGYVGRRHRLNNREE